MSAPEDKEAAKQKKIKELAETLGINHLFTEIDSLKDNVAWTKTKIEEISVRTNDVIGKINDFTLMIEKHLGTAQEAPAQNLLKPSATGLLADPAAAQGLVTLLEGLGKAYQAFKGTQAVATPSVNFAEMGAEFMQLLMKTSFDKLLMSTYDVALPPPKRLIQKVSEVNMSGEHGLA